MLATALPGAALPGVPSSSSTSSSASAFSVPGSTSTSTSSLTSPSVSPASSPAQGQHRRMYSPSHQHPHGAHHALSQAQAQAQAQAHAHAHAQALAHQHQHQHQHHQHQHQQHQHHAMQSSYFAPPPPAPPLLSVSGSTPIFSLASVPGQRALPTGVTTAAAFLGGVHEFDLYSPRTDGLVVGGGAGFLQPSAASIGAVCSPPGAVTSPSPASAPAPPSATTGTTPRPGVASLFSPPKAPQKWTPEEDELLRQSVARLGCKKWKVVAQNVPGRSHIQCLQRWNKVLKPGIKKGAWLQEEDDLVRRSVLEQTEAGSTVNWAVVAQAVVGRTAKQCRERWRCNLDPNILKADWSREEDEMLFALQRELGNRWALISKSLPGRTENAIKTRFRSFMRAEKKKWAAAEDAVVQRHLDGLITLDEAIAQLPGRTRNSVRKRGAALRAVTTTAALAAALSPSIGGGASSSSSSAGAGARVVSAEALGIASPLPASIVPGADTGAGAGASTVKRARVEGPGRVPEAVSFVGVDHDDGDEEDEEDEDMNEDEDEGEDQDENESDGRA